MRGRFPVGPLATIHISMSGEGRGHAARVRALTEHLRRRHRIHLHAPGDAYRLLRPLYEGTDVSIRPLPGLAFRYGRSGRLDYPATAAASVPYVLGLRALVRDLVERLREDAPDLVITDFEPALPRAARALGVPFLSLDHQHFLLVDDLSELPRRLRAAARVMGAVVKRYYSGQVCTVVSSFYSPPVRPDVSPVRQIGVVLREEMRRQAPRDGGHLCCYLRRRFRPEHVQPWLDALRRSGVEARIYGLGERPPIGALRFRAIDTATFTRDLATCAGVVCTSGNQLVGEAIHLEKPVLALAEPANAEQEINGFYLERSGAGRAQRLVDFQPAHLFDFLERLPDLAARAHELDTDGTDGALRAIEDHLPAAVAPREPSRAAAELLTA